MDDNDNLDLLASLLEENGAAAEHISEESDINNMGAASEPDDYDKLFDEEDEESYTEEVEDVEGESSGSKEDVAELFGDVGDLSEEEQEKDTIRGTSLSVAVAPAKETTNQALQDELRKLQEQMKKLQKQLEMTAIAQPVSAGPSKKTSDKSPAAFIKERKPPKLQESPCFSTQLNNSSFPRSKIQCHNPASLSGIVDSFPLFQGYCALLKAFGGHAGHMAARAVLRQCWLFGLGMEISTVPYSRLRLDIHVKGLPLTLCTSEESVHEIIFLKKISIMSYDFCNKNIKYKSG